MIKLKGNKLKRSGKFRTCDESALSSVSALVNKLNISLAGSNLFSKQTNNNEETNSAEVKDDCDLNTDNDDYSDKDDERILSILPWHNNFKREYMSALGTKNINLLHKLLNLFLKKISKSVQRWYKNPEVAALLRKYIYNTLLFFHLFYQDTKDSIKKENSYYLNKMSNIVSIYINMALTSSTLNKETPVKKISNKLINALYLFLGNSIQHILDAILKSKFFDVNFREITAPVLETVLKKVSYDPTDESLYMRYIFAFKLWKKITVDKLVKNKIVRMALQHLVPPKNCINKAKQYFKIPFSKHKNVTLYIMQGKFDLKSSCQEFYKIQEEKHQTQFSSSIITKKPVFIEDSDGARFSECDQIGKEDRSFFSFKREFLTTIPAIELDAKKSHANGQRVIPSEIFIKTMYAKPNKEMKLITFNSSNYKKHKSNEWINKSDKLSKLSSLESKPSISLYSKKYKKNKLNNKKFFDQNKLNEESDILNIEVEKEATDYNKQQININQKLSCTNVNKQMNKIQENTILKPSNLIEENNLLDPILKPSNLIEENNLLDNGVLTINIEKNVICQEDNVEFIFRSESNEQKNKLIKENEKKEEILKNLEKEKTKLNTSVKEKKCENSKREEEASLENNTNEFSKSKLGNKIAQSSNADTPVLSPCDDNSCDTLPCNETKSVRHLESNEIYYSAINTPNLSTPAFIPIDLEIEKLSNSTPDQFISENKKIQIKFPEEKVIVYAESNDFDTIQSESFIIKETNPLKNVDCKIDTETNIHNLNDINYSNTNTFETDQSINNSDSLIIENESPFDPRIELSSFKKYQTSKSTDSDSQCPNNNKISVNKINTKSVEMPSPEIKQISSKSLEIIPPENCPKKTIEIEPPEIQDVTSPSSQIKNDISSLLHNPINEIKSLPFLSQVKPKISQTVPILENISLNSGTIFIKGSESISNLSLDSCSLENVTDSKFEPSTEFNKCNNQIIQHSIESTSLIIHSTPVENQISLSTSSKIQATDSSPYHTITHSLSDINLSNSNKSKTDQTINNYDDSLNKETESPIEPQIRSPTSEKDQISKSPNSDSLLAKSKPIQTNVESSFEIKPSEIQDISSFSTPIKNGIFSSSCNSNHKMNSLPFISQVISIPKMFQPEPALEDNSPKSANAFNSELKSNLQIETCSQQNLNDSKNKSSEEFKKSSNQIIKQSIISTSFMIQTPNSSTQLDNQLFQPTCQKIQTFDSSPPMINQISEPISSKSVSQISSQSRKSFNGSNTDSDELLNLAPNNEIRPDSSSQINSDKIPKAKKVESYQHRQVNKGFSKCLTSSVSENEKEIQISLEVKEKDPSIKNKKLENNSLDNITINNSEVKSIPNKPSGSIVNKNSKEVSSLHPLLKTNKTLKVLLSKLDPSSIPSSHSSKVDSEEIDKIPEEKIEANTDKQIKCVNYIPQEEPINNKQHPQEFLSSKSSELDNVNFLMNIDGSKQIPIHEKSLKTTLLEPNEIPSTSKQPTENILSYPPTPMISELYKANYTAVKPVVNITESNAQQDLRISPEQNSDSKDTEELSQYEEEEPSPPYEPLDKQPLVHIYSSTPLEKTEQESTHEIDNELSLEAAKTAAHIATIDQENSNADNSGKFNQYVYHNSHILPEQVEINTTANEPTADDGELVDNGTLESIPPTTSPVKILSSQDIDVYCNDSSIDNSMGILHPNGCCDEPPSCCCCNTSPNPSNPQNSLVPHLSHEASDIYDWTHLYDEYRNYPELPTFELEKGDILERYNEDNLPLKEGTKRRSRNFLYNQRYMLKRRLGCFLPDSPDVRILSPSKPPVAQKTPASFLLTQPQEHSETNEPSLSIHTITDTSGTTTQPKKTRGSKGRAKSTKLTKTPIPKANRRQKKAEISPKNSIDSTIGIELRSSKILRKK